MTTANLDNVPSQLLLKEATQEEIEKVNQLKLDIEPILAEYDGEAHEEMVHEHKLLRFVRGHDKKAVQAFESHLNYRKERNVDEARKILLEEEEKRGVMPWPYDLDMFKPLMEGIWKGVAPAVHHGHSPEDNSCVTITVIANYDFEQIVSKGLEDLWLKMTLYCDVYFDIQLHRLSLEHEKLVYRHDIVDVTGLALSMIGRKSINLLKRMGESAEQYPEMVGKTTACNVSSVGVSIWSMAKGFIPKQTAAKMSIHTTDYKDSLKEAGIVDHNLPRRLNGVCECETCEAHIDKSKGVVYIVAGKEHDIVFNVDAGDELVWEILDISAKLPRKIILNDKVVFESEKEKSGSYICKEKGIVKFQLCNKKSWVYTQNATLHCYINKASSS